MPDLVVLVVVAIGALVLVAVASSLFGRVTIYEYQRGLRFRNGSFAGLLGPGRHWIYRPSTKITPVDIRESLFSVPGQEVVTSDGFSVKLSLVVGHKVVDPLVALTKVENFHQVVYSAAQIQLREVVSGMTIDDLLQRRNEIGPAILERTAESARAAGVELLSVDVKDLMFPGPLKKTFTQVVEARQQGLAALEKARGETAALRNLANAARLVDANPSLLQLRLLQQLEGSSGNTLVVGFPTNSTPLPVRSDATDKPAELPPSTTETSDQP